MKSELSGLQPGNKAQKQVAAWLLIGVAMIVIQVMLGGITRLTESGLSITEWKPITGVLPPLNNTGWQAEFDRYKVTDQFKYVHPNFSLADFKSIFFWEWFHRTWARMMGIVFLVGFVYFIVSKKLQRSMITPMVVLFILGGLQGAIGWIMVKSGLVPEKYFVGHVELTTHFIAALGLLCYTLWFALGLLITPQQLVISARSNKLLIGIIALFIVQLVFGGFMAGLRAAVAAPTWPDINGKMIPPSIGELEPPLRNIVYNPIAVHFIHRGIAYLLFILAACWLAVSKRMAGKPLYNTLRAGFPALVLLQVVLGILTVLNATYNNRLVWLGVMHQFTALLILVVLVGLLFITRRRQPSL